MRRQCRAFAASPSRCTQCRMQQRRQQWTRSVVAAHAGTCVVRQLRACTSDGSHVTDALHTTVPAKHAASIGPAGCPERRPARSHAAIHIGANEHNLNTTSRKRRCARSGRIEEASVAVLSMLFIVALASASVTSSALSITSFQDARFEWNNGVPQHSFEDGGSAVTITPTPNLDYWSRTFYEPLLVKHDAQCLLTPVAADVEATLTTAFTLKPRAQFDQAGIMVLVNESTWVKAGIEFTDGSPRLSCVVTNDGYSDWSTQEWLDWDAAAQSTSIRVRVSKLLPGSAQGPALVFEAAPWVEGATATSAAPWVQIRIASLRSGEQPWRMGLFAISPTEAQGSSSRFHHVVLGPKLKPVHSTDAGLPDSAHKKEL